jgi:hypothetical protein
MLSTRPTSPPRLLRLPAGYRELACDARLENLASHALHAALGFAAIERVVFFRKAPRP